MNATATIGGVDCSDRIVFVNRHHSICSMVGGAEIGLDPTWNQAFSPYDTVVITENGTKTFTGFMANIGHSRMPPARVVNCQCPLKKVRDYWFTEFSTGGSQVPTLIDSIMTTVGVSYSINDSYAYPTAEEEWMNTSAMDVFQSLLTMAGWQAYSDADGVVQIGRLTKGAAEYTFNEGDNLISVESAHDDSWIRNAIAVYGAPGISTKQYGTGYEEFERAGAFANPLIATEATAIDVATKALALFNSELHVVHAEVLGDPDVWIGQTASVTDTFTGLDAHTDMITTVRASMSSDGYILNAMLGERCPTIWGFGAAAVARYLYAATDGQGVYRSEDYGDSFDAANGVTAGSTLTGDALYVNAIEVDSAYNETVWAATRGGIYRTQDGGVSTWDYMDPGELPLYTGGSMSSGSVVWYDVDQDELNPERLYFIGVDHDSQESWIVKYSSGSWAHWNCRWADR